MRSVGEIRQNTFFYEGASYPARRGKNAEVFLNV